MVTDLLNGPTREVSYLTLTTDVSPGMMGLLSHFGVVHPQLSLHFEIMSGSVPVLRTWCGTPGGSESPSPRSSAPVSVACRHAIAVTPAAGHRSTALLQVTSQERRYRVASHRSECSRRCRCASLASRNRPTRICLPGIWVNTAMTNASSRF